MINATENRMTMEIHRQSALARQISETQISISTGRRIQRGSDDPVAASRVANIRQAQSDNLTWKSNLVQGSALAAHADGIVQNLTDRMARAQELMVAGSSGNLNPADRAVIAFELNEIASEIDEFSVSRSALNSPVFAAANANEIRFSADEAFAPVPSRSEVFEYGGNSLGTIVRAAATAAASGSPAETGASLSALNAAAAHTADMAADVGVRAAKIERMREALELKNVEFAAERSQLEDTDLSEAIARLNAQMLTLEAAQSSFARINRRTLFDILS
jgi:flagellar hook-associated protein 3 FlgL